MKYFDQHHRVDLKVLLILFKVFNTVMHNKLLLKLKHYGIESNTYLWLQEIDGRTPEW